jgi:capsule biosynthesis phosphatase
MNQNKIIVLDVDQTLTTKKVDGITYADVGVAEPVKARLKKLKAQGYWIILSTSRNMRTYQGNIGQIIKHTAPVLLEWLDKNEIPYDEIHFGKPWCGFEGFYVDDRAIRPREFVSMSIDEITALLDRDRF